ncbi:MAG: hypothetical protein FWB86_06670 [Treponema sp.]|nr:hypothetical protein [Treponema sp.]
MSYKKIINISFILILLVFLASCGPMESLFPSIGNYKINVQINDISLDYCSFARSIDTIRPYFEETISNDPDVTGLIAFLRDSSGMTVGWKVIYELVLDDSEDTEDTGNESETDDEKEVDVSEEENEELKQTKSGETDEGQTMPEQEPAQIEKLPEIKIDQYNNGDELFIYVKNLNDLPVFPMPNDLPMGRYTLVFHVMGGHDVLQKIEKNIFYLSRTDFSYEGINVHLPGIAEKAQQFIPKATLVMLEANVKFDNKLDPYIIWYNGKVKIHEGSFSDGAGSLFWKTPDESGFFSLRAVVYPIENYNDLSGYQKEISLLVSSKTIDIHLITNEVQQEMAEQDQDLYWYIFEGNLNDSKLIENRTLTHSGNSPKWKASNGTYGAASGFNNYINMPKTSFSNTEQENLHILFRFKPKNDGGIFSVKLGKRNDVYMHLYLEGSNLYLTLTSPNNTVTQVYPLLRQNTSEYLPDNVLEETEFFSDDILEQELDPEVYSELQRVDISNTEKLRAWIEEDTFFTVNILLSFRSGFISAKMNVLGMHGIPENYIDSKLAANAITLEEKIENEFQIILGSLRENIKPKLIDEVSDLLSVIRNDFTALWDEFVFYFDKTHNDFSKILPKLQSNPKETQSNGETTAIIKENPQRTRIPILFSET